MRAYVIFGPNSSERDLRSFARVSNVSWMTGFLRTKDEADVVILFGGDGTIHRHLPQLVELQLPVLIVPRGSGNDFARALNLRVESFSECLAKVCFWWKQCQAGGCRHDQELPAGQFDFRGAFFCTVAGVGIDGEVRRRVNRCHDGCAAMEDMYLHCCPPYFDSLRSR